MNHLEQLLTASVVIEKQKHVINNQAREIALLRTRLRLIDLRESKRLQAIETLPALLRQQAG